MIDQETRELLQTRVKPVNAIDMAKAIEVAIRALINWGGDEEAQAAMTLLMVYDQQGCDHLDTGGRNTGRLTDAMSVIVFG